jgi:DNA-binding CsgD family transcriptional regulator/tetratricopeptide (TPR) repeat protein
VVELIGRDAALGEITALLSRAGHGCAALCVVAEPGLGKSALLAEAGERAEAAGFRLLRCTGVEAETAMQYSALTDLLQPVLPDVTGWLSPPQRHALDVISLRAEPGEEPVEPQGVARAALTALSAAARTAPVILIVDDAQWLDPETRRVLGFVLRRATADRLAILLARRDEPAATDDLAVAVATLGADRERRLQLRPLTPGQIEQVLAEHGLAVARGPLRRIQKLADGNPLYALELARTAREDPDAALTLPGSLAALVRRRILALPPLTVAALAAAAQLAVPSRELIARAMDASAPGRREALETALDAAVDALVLVESEAALRFAHPLLAEAASATADAASRRRVHRRLADAVTHVEHRALHLSMAYTQPDADVADAIEAGARQARARAAPEVAAELLAAAVRLTPPERPAERRRRQVECAYHWAAAGKVDSGIRMLSAALDGESTGAGRADLEWRSGMLHFLAGDLRTSVELLSLAQDHASPGPEREQIKVRLASMCGWRGDFRTSAAIADGIDVSQLDALASINARGVAAMAHFALGHALPYDPLDLIAEFESLDPPPPPHEHPASRDLTLMLPFAPITDLAAGARRAYDLAVAAEDDLGMAWQGAMLARTLLHAGEWGEAATVAESALRAGRRAGSVPGLVLALLAVGWIAAHRGDVPYAREIAGELLVLNAPQPLLSCDEQARAMLAFLELSAGDAQAAAKQLGEACAALRRTGNLEPAMYLATWLLGESLLDAGRVEEADAESSVLMELAERLDHRLAAAMAWTARARLAAARGERQGADAAFERALAAHERLGWPFERAVTLFAQGRTLLQQQRRSLARAALTAAADGFAALGAPLWEQRVRAELAAVPGRVPVAADALTATERRVAELAATGLTNQEIADQLCVSVKTVATHLSHTYAKLQLRSRTELARRLGR